MTRPPAGELGRQKAVIWGREHGGDRQTDGGGGRGDVCCAAGEAVGLGAVVDCDEDECVAGFVSGELAVEYGFEF